MILHILIGSAILVPGMIIGNFEKDSNRKINILLLMGLFYFFSAFRSENVGNDTLNYINAFRLINDTEGLDFNKLNMEPGYQLLNKLISLIFNNSQWILIITSLIIYISVGYFIHRYSKNVWFSAFLFFSLNYYTNSMNIIRTYIVISVLLYSYKFVQNNKFKYFFMLVLLASLFHQTALIFLIAWFSRKININKTFFIWISLITIIIFLTFPIIIRYIMFIFPSYASYFGSSYLDGQIELGSILSFLVNFSLLILSLLIYKYSFKYNNNNLIERKYLNNMLVLLIIGVAISFIALHFSLLSRVSNYFIIFVIILLPNLIKYIKSKAHRLLVYFGVINLSYLYSITIFLLRPEWNRIYPFSFFWN